MQRHVGFELVEVHGVAADAAGNALMVLDFKGKLDLGTAEAQSTCATGSFRRDALLIKLDPGGKLLFSRQFPCAEAMAVSVVPGGGILFTGSLRTTVDFGTGPLIPDGVDRDVFVAAFDDDGKTLWSKVYPAPNTQRVSAIAVDGAGNIALVGGFESDFDFGDKQKHEALSSRTNLFIAKLDPRGQHLWSKSVPSSLWHGPAVTFDQGGNLLVAASTRNDATDLGGGLVGQQGGMLIGKLSPAGDHLWSKVFGTRHDAVNEIAVDQAGDVLFVGETSGAIDFGGGPIGEGGDDTTDPVVVKLDPDGKHLWSRQFGVRAFGIFAGNAQASSIALDSAGNVFVAGKILDGTVDFGAGELHGDAGNFLAKLDADGKAVWGTHLLSRSRFDPSHHDLAVDSGGSVFIAGDVSRKLRGGGSTYGFLVAKFGP